MKKLSLCMIVKNEEKLLEKCLKSVMPAVDEIIITDTGSSDNTIDIAGKYADHIEHFNWINDFSAARNYCAKFASHDYIMTWDADNILDSASIPFIKELKSKNFMNLDLISGEWHVELGDDKQPIKTLSKAIIYRKDKLIWQDAIHEFLSPIKAGITIKQNTFPKIEFSHYKDRKDKAERYQQNLQLTKAILEKQPKNSRLLFFYGESLLDANRLEQAEAVFQEYLNKYLHTNKTQSILAIEKLMIVYLSKNEANKALALVDKHKKKLKSFPRFQLVHADVIAVNNLKAAAEYYQNYLENPVDADTKDSYYDHERYFIHPRWMLANIYLLNNNAPQAQKLLNVVAKETHLNKQKQAAVNLLRQLLN